MPRFKGITQGITASFAIPNERRRFDAALQPVYRAFYTLLRLSISLSFSLSGRCTRAFARHHRSRNIGLLTHCTRNVRHGDFSGQITTRTSLVVSLHGPRFTRDRHRRTRAALFTSAEVSFFPVPRASCRELQAADLFQLRFIHGCIKSRSSS